MPIQQRFLDIACEQGIEAGATGERSSKGAVLAKQDELIAASRDRRLALNDPVATAELDCIRRAGRRSDQRSLTMYITDYPDMLAAGTIIQFSIGNVIIGKAAATSPAIELLRLQNIPVAFEAHQGCSALTNQTI